MAATYETAIEKLVKLHPEVPELRNVIQHLLSKRTAMVGNCVLYGIDQIRTPPSDLYFLLMRNKDTDGTLESSESAEYRMHDLIRYVIAVLDRFDPQICLEKVLEGEMRPQIERGIRIIFEKLPRLSIQIDAVSETTVSEINESSCFDYARCEIGEGKLLIANAATRAYERRTIDEIIIRDEVSHDNHVKNAINMGFSMPIFMDKFTGEVQFAEKGDQYPRTGKVIEDYTHSKFRVMKYSEFLKNYHVEPISAKNFTPRFSVIDAQITGITLASSSRHVHQYRWIISAGETKIEKLFVSLLVQADDVRDLRFNDNAITCVMPVVNLQDLGFERISVNINRKLARVVTKPMKSRHYIAVVEVYSVIAEGDKLRLNIIALYDIGTTPIKPIPIDEERVVASLHATQNN